MDTFNHTKAWGHTALINGKQVPYDLCHDSKESQFSEGMEYLGAGVIYKICNTLQDDTQVKHFWAYKKK